VWRDNVHFEGLDFMNATDASTTRDLTTQLVIGYSIISIVTSKELAERFPGVKDLPQSLFISAARDPV